jgi:hypothetical protein
MAVGLEGIPHLDMLPPSRRLWRDVADRVERSCRLVALEAIVCGVVRVGDVPGIEIPRRYFEYFRSGDVRQLEPVLHHNRMDLLSLAALTARAQRLVRGGADAARDPAECLSLGRLLHRRGDSARAESCYRRVLGDRGASHREREQARHSLAMLLRRGKRFGEAAHVWRELVNDSIARTPALREAIEALAVHHEHRERDLSRARGYAERALHAERDPRRREAVHHRLARIERKLQSATGGVQPSLIGGTD